MSVYKWAPESDDFKFSKMSDSFNEDSGIGKSFHSSGSEKFNSGSNNNEEYDIDNIANDEEDDNDLSGADIFADDSLVKIQMYRTYIRASAFDKRLKPGRTSLDFIKMEQDSNPANPKLLKQKADNIRSFLPESANMTDKQILSHFKSMEPEELLMYYGFAIVTNQYESLVGMEGVRTYEEAGKEGMIDLAVPLTSDTVAHMKIREILNFYIDSVLAAYPGLPEDVRELCDVTLVPYIDARNNLGDDGEEPASDFLG